MDGSKRPDISPLLGAYLDGELNGKEKKLVEEELARSPRFRKELDGYKSIKEMGSFLDPPDVSPEEWGDCWGEISDGIQDPATTPRSNPTGDPPSNRFSAALLVAASLLFLPLFSTGFWLDPQPATGSTPGGIPGAVSTQTSQSEPGPVLVEYMEVPDGYNAVELDGTVLVHPDDRFEG